MTKMFKHSGGFYESVGAECEQAIAPTKPDRLDHIGSDCISLNF